MKVFYLGVDVSKKKLDLCLRSNGKDILYDVIPNDLSSIKSWLTRTFEKFFLSEDSLVVCAEHTGQYTYPLVCATKSIGVYLCLEDAAKIKYCHGIPRGKNDKIDACRIAMYAERYNDCLQPYTASELIIQKLKNLSTERSMLVADRAKYQSQLKDQVDYMEHSIYIAKCNRVEGIINTFTDYIAQIDLEIKELINQAPVIAHQMDLLMSVDGVGERVALKMIMETDAFTSFTDPRKFCCHAGVVPFVYVSGSSQRSKNRVSNRADKSIKHLLHMAALSVSQVKNSPLKKYYDRKVEEGKNKMVGRIPVFRPRKTGDMLTLPDGRCVTLKKLFLDRRLPQPVRDRVPVLELDGQVIAVAGFGADPRWTARDGEQAVILRIEKEEM